MCKDVNELHAAMMEAQSLVENAHEEVTIAHRELYEDEWGRMQQREKVCDQFREPVEIEEVYGRMTEVFEEMEKTLHGLRGLLDNYKGVYEEYMACNLLDCSEEGEERKEYDNGIKEDGWEVVSLSAVSTPLSISSWSIVQQEQQTPTQ